MKFSCRCSLSILALLLFLLPACSMEATPTSSQSTSSQGSWSRKAPLPIQISENTVAAVNNKIYVIGGSTADRVDHQSNYEYDIATDRWRTRAPLPSGMTHAAATGLNGKIYVVGAFTQTGHGGAVSLVYEYDPVKDAWRTLAPMKSPRGSVGITVLNGKIHAVGGRGVDQSYRHHPRNLRSGDQSLDGVGAAAARTGSSYGRRSRRTHSCRWRPFE